MDFRLLGPLEIRSGGREITVGRRQERCLLGILLLSAGQVVTTDRLVSLLWESPPPGARATVHTYVARLRQTLPIVTRGDGYLIDPAGHYLDTLEFASLSREAATAPDAATRVSLYSAALALWRGPLDGPERLTLPLREMWLSDVRHRASEMLTMGQHALVVADLMPVVDDHPTQEPLVALLMTALYRDGRHAEALHRYDVTAKLLRTELDVPPGTPLRTLRDQILRGDPRLDRPPAPAYAVRVRDQWLPWNVGGHPALEFCNTYAGWNSPFEPAGEWLRGYAALAAWSEHMDLTDPATVSGLLRLARRAPREAAEILKKAKQLRSHLYAVLTDPSNNAAFESVAEFAQSAAAASVFTLDGNGLGRWVLTPASGLAVPLHAAANAAATLLADSRRFTVAACPAPECGWLFLDESRRRRFCSVATCST